MSMITKLENALFTVEIDVREDEVGAPVTRVMIQAHGAAIGSPFLPLLGMSALTFLASDSLISRLPEVRRTPRAFVFRVNGDTTEAAVMFFDLCDICFVRG